MGRLLHKKENDCGTTFAGRTITYNDHDVKTMLQFKVPKFIVRISKGLNWVINHNIQVEWYLYVLIISNK